tara:strand:- start:850 stop:1749 length:900 start_codon:yes stop_codon:yes gene_type:complete
MNKKLLFLGCNFDQIPYLKFLKNKNFQIIGLDLNLNAPGKTYCDKFYNIGYDNLNGLLQVGKKENFNSGDMVFTAASQFAKKGAAHFSAYFGIKFPSERSIDICLNKSLFYDYFIQNDVPIPQTYLIKNEIELKKRIEKFNSQFLYLKSDFSKNPKYVYRFNSSNIPLDKIFWGKDRYLSDHYILQKEVKGQSLRINIYGNRFNVFNFLNQKKTFSYHNQIKKLDILSSLRRVMKKLEIESWLVKFDIILNPDNYVVLDIGLDPPMRMRNFCKSKNINFEKHYLSQYLYGKLNYPDILD